MFCSKLTKFADSQSQFYFIHVLSSLYVFYESPFKLTDFSGNIDYKISCFEGHLNLEATYVFMAFIMTEKY